MLLKALCKAYLVIAGDKLCDSMQYTLLCEPPWSLHLSNKPIKFCLNFSLQVVLLLLHFLPDRLGDSIVIFWYVFFLAKLLVTLIVLMDM